MTHGRRWAAPGVALAASALWIVASGVGVWLSLGVAAVAALISIRPLLSDARAEVASKIALALGAFALLFTLAELLLAVIERAEYRPLPLVPPPASDILDPTDPLRIELPEALAERIEIMQGARVMPRSWRKRKLPAQPGHGRRPYVWHDVLHIGDEHRFRRVGPLPERNPERLRIVALGDSMTYGMGVPAEWNWPPLLERWLGEEVPVEILNLGVPGYASEDVLATAEKLLPQLQPDLVLYAVCLNDFLGSREGVLEGWDLPLPRKLRLYFHRRTRVGNVVIDRYRALLRRLGLRPGFYSQLIASPHWPELRARFARDMEALEALVEREGLPPVVALVLDAAPDPSGPGRKLADITESILTAAGMEVIPSRDFYERFAGHSMRISRWESHPNEEAMLLFASQFRGALGGRPELTPSPHRTPP